MFAKCIFSGALLKTGRSEEWVPATAFLEFPFKFQPTGGGRSPKFIPKRRLSGCMPGLAMFCHVLHFFSASFVFQLDVQDSFRPFQTEPETDLFRNPGPGPVAQTWDLGAFRGSLPQRWRRAPGLAVCGFSPRPPQRLSTWTPKQLQLEKWFDGNPKLN